MGQLKVGPFGPAFFTSQGRLPHPVGVLLGSGRRNISVSAGYAAKKARSHILLDNKSNALFAATLNTCIERGLLNPIHSNSRIT